MRYLVTGANGFVGQFLCAELKKQGQKVRAAVRTENIQTDTYERVIVGQIDASTNWTDALAGIDVVIHLAGRAHIMQEVASDPLAEYSRINIAGTEHLASLAAASGVKRLVYVSSIKVNGEETLLGRAYSELDPASPKDPYSFSKWEAEKALHRVAQETGLEVVIVRPPLVYGPEVKGNFGYMLNELGKGTIMPFHSIHNLRSLIYVGNFVDALLTCAIHPAAAGQTYLVSDGEDISTPELLRQLGLGIGRPARLLPIPPVLLKLAGLMTGRSGQVLKLLESLQVDSSKIRRELGWRPPYTLDEGLRATSSWFKVNSD